MSQLGVTFFYFCLFSSRLLSSASLCNSFTQTLYNIQCNLSTVYAFYFTSHESRLLLIDQATDRRKSYVGTVNRHIRFRRVIVRRLLWRNLCYYRAYLLWCGPCISRKFSFLCLCVSFFLDCSPLKGLNQKHYEKVKSIHLNLNVKFLEIKFRDIDFFFFIFLRSLKNL